MPLGLFKHFVIRASHKCTNSRLILGGVHTTVVSQLQMQIQMQLKRLASAFYKF